MKSNYTGNFVKLIRNKRNNFSGFNVSFLKEEYRLNKFISISAGAFLIRVQGDSMINAGIYDGNYLLMESNTTNVLNKIIIAELDNKITLKRLIKIDEYYFLKPENPEYDLIRIDNILDLKVWGIATKVIKDVTDRIG